MASQPDFNIAIGIITDFIETDYFKQNIEHHKSAKIPIEFINGNITNQTYGDIIERIQKIGMSYWLNKDIIEPINTFIQSIDSNYKFRIFPYEDFEKGFGMPTYIEIYIE